MWGRSRPNRDVIRSFVSVTGSTDDVAINFLKRNRNNVEAAIDDFYATPGDHHRQVRHSKENEKLFEKYKEIGIKEGGDPDNDAIQGDGMMALVLDLKLDPMDVMVFVLCWKLQVKEQFTITREEFLNGLARERVDGMKQLVAKIPEWRKELADPEKFKDLHNYVFEYTRAPEAKSIPLDIAIPTWRILFGDRYEHMEAWLNFLETEYKKAVSRDTWQQFLEFTQVIKSDFSDYDEDSAWPVVIDDFVYHMKEKK